VPDRAAAHSGLPAFASALLPTRFVSTHSHGSRKSSPALVDRSHEIVMRTGAANSHVLAGKLAIARST
jgi:hypothetical protein